MRVYVYVHVFVHVYVYVYVYVFVFVVVGRAATSNGALEQSTLAYYDGTLFNVSATSSLSSHTRTHARTHTHAHTHTRTHTHTHTLIRTHTVYTLLSLKKIVTFRRNGRLVPPSSTYPATSYQVI